MFKDEVKDIKNVVPVVSFERNHKKGSVPEDFSTISHNHKELEVLIINDGKARFFIDSQTYDAKKGDIIIVTPYVLHHTTIFRDENFSHNCLCFDSGILPDTSLKTGLESGTVKISPVIRAEENCASQLFSYIKSAYSALSAEKEGFELTVSGNLILFFALLKESGYITQTASPKNENDICYRIIKYIENNYMYDITSSEAADEFFVSRGYFCRIFKKNFGTVFQNYVCMYRIEKAKHLLLFDDIPISEIAISLGFTSFSYFSRMFRKYTGFTPSEYRRKNV